MARVGDDDDLLWPGPDELGERGPHAREHRRELLDDEPVRVGLDPVRELAHRFAHGVGRRAVRSCGRRRGDVSAWTRAQATGRATRSSTGRARSRRRTVVEADVAGLEAKLLAQGAAKRNVSAHLERRATSGRAGGGGGGGEIEQLVREGSRRGWAGRSANAGSAGFDPSTCVDADARRRGLAPPARTGRAPESGSAQAAAGLPSISSTP